MKEQRISRTITFEDRRYSAEIVIAENPITSCSDTRYVINGQQLGAEDFVTAMAFLGVPLPAR